MKTLVSRLFLVGVVACALACHRGHEIELFQPPSDRECVAVIGTNDLHGVIEPQTLAVGDVKLRYGGALALSGYLDVLRKRYGDRLVLVDGGDLYQGTIVSNLSEGRAVLAACNQLGYVASAVGNHEFDFGPGEAGGDDKLRIVKQRIAEAHFPFLVANVFEKTTGRPVEWPNTRASVLVEAGGMKVGIVGASTVETPKVTRPENVATLDFMDPVPFVQAEAAKLRQAGAKLVVLIGHLGGKCSDLVDPYDLSSCEPGAELFDLLARLPKGTVDVAVGGHTHAYIAQWVNGVATIEAGARGRSFGWVDACVSADGGIDAAASKIYRPVTLCLDEWEDGGCNQRKDPLPIRPAKFLHQPIVPNPELEAALAPFLAEVQNVNKKPLGVRLPHALERDGKTPGLGEALCEATALAAGASIGLQNRGGLRADLPAGELTYGQVFEVLPFDNHVAVLHLTGLELRRLVAHLVKRRSGAPPFAFGLNFTASADGFDVRLSNGQAIDDDARYRVATSDFIATGGEGLDDILKGLAPHYLEVTGKELRQALIQFFRSRYPSETPPPAN